MGQRTLAMFRSNLNFALGDRDLGKGFLDAAINDGYLDLTGSHDLVQLRAVSTVTLVGTSIGITLPDDLQWVRAVWNVTDKWQILKMASEHLHAMEDVADDDRDDRYYTRDGDALYIQPPFVTDKVIAIHYNAEPLILSSDSDTTVLPSTYDRAIHMFAMNAALSDLGEEIRAVEWLNKAIVYLRTRLDLEDKESTPAMQAGVRFIRNTKDLKRLYGEPNVG